MSFLFLIIILLAAVLLAAAGLFLSRRKSGMEARPSIGLRIILLLQILLLVLFFSDHLAWLNETAMEIVWWGIVLGGFIFGAKNVMRDVILSLISIFLSIFSAGLMLLVLFITSM